MAARPLISRWRCPNCTNRAFGFCSAGRSSAAAKRSGRGRSQDRLLHFDAVLFGFRCRGQPVGEGQRQFTRGRIVVQLAGQRKEVAGAALGVVARGRRLCQHEAHAVLAQQIAHGEGIVAEAFGALDVVLVAVGPGEEDLFAVVGHGVGCARRSAAWG